MADEAILAKIKKALALTTSDNPNEAANAQALAQKLLLLHHISEEELNEFSLTKNEKVIEVHTKGKAGYNRIAWYSRLASHIARANLCYLFTSGSGLIWVGKPTDLEIAQYLFETVANDLMRLCDASWAVVNANQKYQPSYLKVHGKTWKNNFYMGACQTINERLTANLQQLKQSDNAVNALVVRNDIEIKEYTEIHYPHLRTVQSTYRRERNAFEAGKEAGRIVQFRNGVGTGGSQGTKLLKG